MQEKFTKGLTFKKYFFIFVLGSFIGTIWEEWYLYIKRIILNYADQSYRLHRGLVFGPFNPVYGIGAIVLTFLLCKKKYKPYQAFLISFLAAGIIEYSCSLFQEYVFGSVSWDYTGQFLSINGRTNIMYMLVFGLMGILFYNYAYTPLSNFLDNLPRKKGNLIYYPIMIFFIINIFFSITSFSRYIDRTNNLEPVTKLDYYLDKHFPNERIENIYVNLIPK